jgi:glycosyltransferase involved in cell wall biosynthesis
MEVPIGLQWELIIVDNCSSDGTGDFAHELLLELNPLKWSIVGEAKPGLMNARMRGASCAKHEMLVFIDDDNWPDVGWLVEAARTVEQYPEVGAFGGWCSPVADAPLPEWFDRHAGKFACGPMKYLEGICKVPFLRGAGLCIRRDAWQQIQSVLNTPYMQGRTGTALSSGDDDFICQLLDRYGWQLYYNPRMHMEHYMEKVRLDSEYLLRIYEGIGRSRAKLRPSVLTSTGWPQVCFIPLKVYYKVRVFPRYLRASFNNFCKKDDLDRQCDYRLAKGMLLG